MKKFIILSFILVSNIGLAEKIRKFGAGVSLGVPTGISLNYFLNQSWSVDGMLSYDFDEFFNIRADLLRHKRNLFTIDEYFIDIYYGAGLRMKDKENQDFLFGPRAVVGIGHFWKSIPLEVFVEAAGVFSIIEETDFDFEAALIARWYF